MFDEKPGLYLAVADPGEGPAEGAGSPPHIFRPKWGAKGRKNFLGAGPPPYLRAWVTGSPPPSPPSSEGLDPPLSSIPLAEVGKDKQ